MIRRRQNTLTLAAVTLVLGVLVVVQLRAQGGGAGLEALSAPELTVLVANLNTRNDQLRTEIATLDLQLRALAGRQARGETSMGQLQSDLARLRAWSGVTAVSGPGVRITVGGPIGAAAIEDLLNELRNAGAEAIAVDDVRVTAGSVVTQGHALQIDGVDIGRRFTLSAIGSPDGLLGAMERPGGIISQLKLFIRATIDIRQVESVRLSATARSLVPTTGEPVE